MKQKRCETWYLGGRLAQKSRFSSIFAISRLHTPWATPCGALYHHYYIRRVLSHGCTTGRFMGLTMTAFILWVVSWATSWCKYGLRCTSSNTGACLMEHHPVAYPMAFPMAHTLYNFIPHGMYNWVHHGMIHGVHHGTRCVLKYTSLVLPHRSSRGANDRAPCDLNVPLWST